jgi:hypothetical protein
MDIYNVPVHMMNIHCVIINKIHRTILKELDIVIQNVCKKLSFASNDSEEKLDSMAEALNEAYQQQNDRINQPFGLENYLELCMYI